MKIIAEPAIEPVSLAEVKQQIGILDTDTVSDALISRRIVEARSWAESYTGRAFITQTREIRWDCFLDEHALPSALTIISVKYIDSDGTETALGSSDYVLDTYTFIPHVRAAYGVSWPSTRAERNAVRIQFTAGYGATALLVPALIKEAIILLVGHWMNHQPQNEGGITISRIPYAVRDMLDGFRLDFL
ncbi:phage conserved hypothetical protein, phiE125 gp8 family [Nitrosospira sp. Nl5]|uniref:head-tail connector protein n=1 Tax=Nitrosospira sp. Nl5 TaxID=200120 RepID=UPI0008835759|nr:phage head-tail connector protein [Nitrosospira sp. Nl5]SCX94138.1 phage conserved hypothetical protein, phiE125 gp8 family [Nitrosospira sp. Nl5]